MARQSLQFRVCPCPRSLPFHLAFKGRAGQLLHKAEEQRLAALRSLEGVHWAKTLTMTRDRLPPQPLLLLLLTLLLAAGSGSASTRGVQTSSCRGGCVEEEDAGSPAEGCAEAGGCLRREGQPCGVYIPKCAPGLQCQPRENEETPLRALLMGQGRCHRPRGPLEETAKESKPQGGASRQRDASRRDRPRSPGTSTTPIRPSPGGVQDSEMGPCRRHLDSVLQQLQTEVFRGGAQGIYVPNCDLRGFYRKQQCRSSQGNRRGPCWCVDPMGRPLPVSPDGHGSSQCSAKSTG